MEHVTVLISSGNNYGVCGKIEEIRPIMIDQT